MQNWEEFTLWRSLLNDPEADMDPNFIREFDENFSNYNKLLLAFGSIMKNADMCSAQEIRDLCIASEKHERLLKGYFGKDLDGSQTSPDSKTS